MNKKVLIRTRKTKTNDHQKQLKFCENRMRKVGLENLIQIHRPTESKKIRGEKQSVTYLTSQTDSRTSIKKTISRK